MKEIHHIASLLHDYGIIPVVTLEDAELAVPVAQALATGGLGLVEVAFRSPQASRALSAIVSHCPQILAGAGTVMNREDAARARDAGAAFIVSPGLDEECASYCRTNNLLYIPGCYTATEIQRALNLNLTLLKFFPAENGGGLSMLSALAAAFKAARFVPTGGLNPENFNPYLQSSFVSCVGCSWVAPKNLIEARDFASISERGRLAVAKMLDFKANFSSPNLPGELSRLLFPDDFINASKYTESIIKATTASLARASFYLRKMNLPLESSNGKLTIKTQEFTILIEQG